MATLSDLAGTAVGKAPKSAINPVLLARGTLLTRDLARTRRLSEEILGLVCTEIGDGRLLARHRATAPGDTYWVMEIRQADEIVTPHAMWNHWGVGLKTRAEVDRAYEFLTANKEEYGLHRVQKPRANHGSYSFYFTDVDTNWWEIECRPEEISYYASVANGDDIGDEKTS